MRRLRPLRLPADPVSRTAYAPGEIAQCYPWFPPVDIPLGSGQTGRLPVLVIVGGYSRRLMAATLPTREAEDLMDASRETARPPSGRYRPRPARPERVLPGAECAASAWWRWRRRITVRVDTTIGTADRQRRNPCTSPS